MHVKLSNILPAAAGLISPSRKEQALEVAVFLFLIVPSMVLSLVAIHEGQIGFVLAATALILRNLALVSLILFFLWHNGEPLARIGWTTRNALRELALGVLLFVPFCAAALLASWAVGKAGLHHSPVPAELKPEGLPEVLLALALVTVVAIAEETIFRGYLLLRGRAVLRGMTAAVILSVAIFTLGHGYEGSAGLAVVALMGLMLALVYLWRGSLLAPIVMHFLQDFLSLVLAPLLGLR